MSAGLLIAAAGLVIAAIVLAASWFRRHEEVDLGTVSHQWIAEQRFGVGHDPRR